MNVEAELAQVLKQRETGARLSVQELSVNDAPLLIARVKHPLLFTLTFCRFSEFTECVVHSSKIFSNSIYRNWFRANHNGYDYDDLVLACNLPDRNFKSFYEAFITAKGKNKINRLERTFLSMLENKNLIQIEGDSLNILRTFYIIVLNEYLFQYHRTNGSPQIEEQTLLHEMSHALFYLNDEYKSIVNDAWKSLDDETRAIATKNLQTTKHFAESVIIDEWWAYSLYDGADNAFPFPTELQNLKDTLTAMVEEHIKVMS